MQTRAASLVEALLNTASGFVLAVVLQFLVAWWYHLPLSPAQNIGITMIFTVASVVRSYLWRRYFNWRIYGPATARRDA